MSWHSLHARILLQDTIWFQARHQICVWHGAAGLSEAAVTQVCDFGLSRVRRSTLLTSKSQAGTPEWCASAAHCCSRFLLAARVLRVGLEPAAALLQRCNIHALRGGSWGTGARRRCCGSRASTRRVTCTPSASFSGSWQPVRSLGPTYHPCRPVIPPPPPPPGAQCYIRASAHHSNFRGCEGS